MPKRVPTWARALLSADAMIGRGRRALEIVRDAILFAGTDEEERVAITEEIYARELDYRPGGAAFERGLFSWEERALDHPAFPKSGRLLLGGAGGGRELAALIARGYGVVAFEPCAALAEAATGVSPRVIVAGYRDLIACVEGRGPLAELREMTFDGIVLGWTSVTYVMPASRAPLFHAIRELAPRAPVLASFWALQDSAAPVSIFGKIARSLLGTIPEGAWFAPHAGFGYRIAQSEIERIAHELAYSLAIVDLGTHPHVLLVPR